MEQEPKYEYPVWVIKKRMFQDDEAWTNTEQPNNQTKQTNHEEESIESDREVSSPQ